MKKVGIFSSLLLTASIALALTARSALAEGSTVTSRSCPYSCRTQGIPKSECRDWRQGNTCFVEDLRQNKIIGSRPQGGHSCGGERPVVYNKGYVTAALCPNSCQTNGIPKNVCRDWREGSVCYVEDLRRPQGFTNLVPANPVYPGDNRYPVSPSNGVAGCGGYVPRPHVDIYKVKNTGNHYKVRGAIEGKCITQAGAFEDGRLDTLIPTVATPDFKRFEFEVKIRKDKDPEIRAYNTQGEREVYQVEGDDYDHHRDDDDDDYDDDYGYHHRR